MIQISLLKMKPIPLHSSNNVQHYLLLFNTLKQKKQMGIPTHLSQNSHLPIQTISTRQSQTPHIQSIRGNTKALVGSIRL